MSLHRIFYQWPAWMAGFAVMAAAGPLSATAEENQDLDCVITPSAVVEVSTAVPGVLQEVNVDRSDQVSKGQLLAQLDSGVELAELNLAHARVEMDAIIKLRETSLRFDRRNSKRLSTLHSNKLVSTEKKDQAERESRLSNWRLQDAKDLQRQRELETLRAQQVLLRRKVFSPIDGIVVQRMLHPGEYVEEQPILRIAQLDPLYVEAIVSMSEFGRIRKGMRAHVFPEISPDKALPAEVVVVDGMGDAASGTFGIRLTLANPEHDIPAGVKCRLQILRERIVNQQSGAGEQALLTDKKLSGVLHIDRR